MGSLKRKFKVTTSTESRFVIPINDEELIYNWKKSDKGIYFDKELKSKLIFCNNIKESIDDFTWFYGYENNISTRCETITCEVFKVCNGIDVLEFKGIIALSEGEWDLDKCVVTLKLITANDVYDCINENKKDETVIAQNFIYTEGGENGGNLYDNEISGKWNFLTVKSINLNTQGFYDARDVSIYPGLKDVPYNSFFWLCYVVVEKLLIKCGQSELYSQIPLLRSDFFEWNPIGDTVGFIPSSIPRPSCTSLSCFGGLTARYTDRFKLLPRTPGINYVTGETNLLTHLFYMPKSSFYDPLASEWEQPITVSATENDNKITFEDIEKIWATMFDAYWFIDTDGSMRVEHSSWFNSRSSLYDSTLLENIKYNVANKKYRYIKELAPRKEVFSFSKNSNFLNGNNNSGFSNNLDKIIYEGVCVNQDKTNNEKKYPLEMVITDFSISDIDNNDNKGLALFTTQFGTPTDTTAHFSDYYYSVVTGSSIAETLVGSIDVTTYENGHVQWANLIRRYLKNNRVLTVGKNGNDLITFTSRTKKTKEQKNVILKHCCSDDDFNPVNAQIKTELGIGDIEEAEYNIKTGLIKITALHD